MKTDQAIVAYAQSEKIKSGLIWIAQCLDRLRGLRGDEKKGSETTVYLLLNMVGHEVDLAMTVTKDRDWQEVKPYLERALVMFNSGVGSECGLHLSKALSNVTNISQRAMEYLRREGLL